MKRSRAVALDNAAAWTLLVAMIFQAFVPIGYMPSQDAKKHNILLLSLCSSSSAPSSVVLELDLENNDSGSHVSEVLCPYNALSHSLSLWIPSSPARIFLFINAALQYALPQPFVTPPPYRVASALGSRAPPFLF